jgi:hypothetical protein
MEHCHTTSLPLVAAYNGFNDNNRYNDCDVKFTQATIERNASENRLSGHITSNNTNSLIRDETVSVIARTTEIVNKQDLNTRDIFNVEKTVFKESCDTRELIAKSTADILLEGAKNTAAITLDACKNTNAILAAIAECCCEQKTLTISQGAETRQLINGNTIIALQAELATARLEAALAAKK